MQINEIVKTIKKADFIYIAGNGGLAAQSDHLACDLIKNAKLKAISLTSNLALITAIINDYDGNSIFLEQLKTLFNFNRDVLLLMSTSGKSKNILKAAYFVKENDGKVITITGNKNSELKKCSDYFIFLNGNMQECEDRIGQFCHILYKDILLQAGIK